MGMGLIRKQRKVNQWSKERGGFIESEMLDEISMRGISYGNIWSPRYTRCDDKGIS